MLFSLKTLDQNSRAHRSERSSVHDMQRDSASGLNMQLNKY